MKSSLTIPELTIEHDELVHSCYNRALSGWYIGTMETLQNFGAVVDLPSRLNPEEIFIRILFTRDKMHHSVGWWRNSDYEYCWHLSLSSRLSTDARLAKIGLKQPQEISLIALPKEEQIYWGRAFFKEHANKVWYEPGGTDPRLTTLEKLRNSSMCHLRLFLDPISFQPFMPEGEVYELKRWIPGLTPEKVDR